MFLVVSFTGVLIYGLSTGRPPRLNVGVDDTCSAHAERGLVHVTRLNMPRENGLSEDGLGKDLALVTSQSSGWARNILTARVLGKLQLSSAASCACIEEPGLVCFDPIHRLGRAPWLVSLG